MYDLLINGTMLALRTPRRDDVITWFWIFALSGNCAAVEIRAGADLAKRFYHHASEARFAPMLPA